MKVFIISYGDYDSEDKIEIFDSVDASIVRWTEMSEQERKSVRHIIQGKEFELLPKKKEVIIEWEVREK